MINLDLPSSLPLPSSPLLSSYLLPSPPLLPSLLSSPFSSPSFLLSSLTPPLPHELLVTLADFLPPFPKC